jgi:hypothetical protein
MCEDAGFWICYSTRSEHASGGDEQEGDEMTESEWLSSSSPKYMLEYVQGTSSDRKMRLFSCACCRRFWDSLQDKRSRHFVETVERFADGLETDVTLDHSYFAARAVAEETSDTVADDLLGLYGACATYEYQQKMRGVVAERAAKLMANDSPLGIGAERIVQAELLRDIIRNPFRSVTINSSWLSPAVSALAQAIYAERSLSSGELDTTRLAVLADALEDGGCDNADILEHLRSSGVHVRGCWALDLLLAKE